MVLHKKRFHLPPNYFLIFSKTYLLCICHNPHHLRYCEVFSFVLNRLVWSWVDKLLQFLVLSWNSLDLHSRPLSKTTAKLGLLLMLSFLGVSLNCCLVSTAIRHQFVSWHDTKEEPFFYFSFWQKNITVTKYKVKKLEKKSSHRKLVLPENSLFKDLFLTLLCIILRGSSAELFNEKFLDVL